MPKRVAAFVATALAGVAATLAWSTAAVADTPGFSVKITQAPQTLTIGKDVRALDASVSTDRDGQRCRKVRWALIVQTQGISLNQIRVGRIENGQSFPVNAQIGADAAQIVDTQLDPGQLCRNQAVTARWEIGFTGPDDGQVAFQVRALDATGRLLASANTGSNVVTPVSATTEPTPSNSRNAQESPSPSASPSTSFSAEPPQAADVTASQNPINVNPAASAGRTGGPSVLGPGLIIGAVLVFVGIALLLRLRSRNRRGPAFADDTQMLPTGFYNLPRRR